MTNLNKETSLSDDHLHDSVDVRTINPNTSLDTADIETPQELPSPLPDHNPPVHTPTSSHNSVSSPVCQMPIPDETKMEEINAQHTVQTVVYDGIEMSALDLEHYSSLSLARDPAVSRSLAAIHQSIEDLAEQTGR